MAHHIARDMAYSAMGGSSGEGSAVPRRMTSAPASAFDLRRQSSATRMYRDLPVVFSDAPPAGSAANCHTEDGAANEESFVQQPFTSHGGGESHGMLGGMHDADEDDDISSQPLLPYVFYGVISDSETVDEFEENWQHMLHCFDLVDNRHLSNMWRRSEGLNSYFKTFVNPQDSVWRFVQQYEVLQETMLDREDNQAFIGHTTTAPLYSRYNFERQAVHFYTRSMFLMFQKEVMASIGLIMNQAPALDNASMRFELHSNYFENPQIFSVNVVLVEEKFECSCNCFEMNGIICAHIIRVMVHLNVQKIPQRYMLERWSEAATTAMSSGGCLLDFGHPATNTLKYNSLCRKYTWLASQACSNDLAYKIMNDAAQQLEPLIAAARQGALQEQQEANQQQATQQQQQTPEPTTVPQPDGGAMLQNPARVPNKGRPTEKSKRRKTLLEQREDAHKNKLRKMKRSKPSPEENLDQRRKHLLARTATKKVTVSKHAST
nr:protein FAR1-RELATED SEQUENCE 9-like [Aegilops tauschii subsp. strangulata]